MNISIDEEKAKPTSVRMSAGNQVAVIVCLIKYLSRFCICLTVITLKYIMCYECDMFVVHGTITFKVAHYTLKQFHKSLENNLIIMDIMVDKKYIIQKCAKKIIFSKFYFRKS